MKKILGKWESRKLNNDEQGMVAIKTQAMTTDMGTYEKKIRNKDKE